MLTPWGEIQVSDAHVHFFSYKFFSILATQKGCAPEELKALLPDWELPPPAPERLAEHWVTEMDRRGVARAALIASLPGDDESVAAAVQAYPKRFYGYFMVNPTAPDAIRDVERALKSALLQGICLFPSMHRYSLHDERVQGILEMAAGRPGTVVFVHCGVLTVSVRKRLGLLSPFDMRFADPVDVHGPASRYPKLSFVIPHFGSGYFREALMVCDQCPNVHLDTSSTNGWTKYHEPPLDLKTVFRRALEVVGTQRLLFGTDSSFFPRGWLAGVFNEQLRILDELGVDAAGARAIFGENLHRILART
jgi:predicted TIM-barrel fold metal-dependent hydrolase